LQYQWHLTRNSADIINAVQWRIYLGRSFFEPCLKIFNIVVDAIDDNAGRFNKGH